MIVVHHVSLTYLGIKINAVDLGMLGNRINNDTRFASTKKPFLIYIVYIYIFFFVVY